MLEQTFHTPLPVTLEVAIPSGDIEVETTEGEETSLTVTGDERMLEHIEIRHDGNRVVVNLQDKGKFGISFSGTGFSIGSFAFGTEGLRVRAGVPNGAGVTVKTASADSQLAGHFGAVELNSASGDVRVRGEVAENVIVKTVSGDVALDRVDGDLSVQCVSGDIRARAVAGSVDTKSVSGDIRVEAVAAGDVRFSSVSGDIEIGIAPGSLLDVDAGSTSGDLSSEVPLASEPPSGEDAVVAPTVVLRGRTVSGDVRVFRAG
jgi:putative adhesin